MDEDNCKLRFELDIASKRMISQLILTEELTKEKLQNAMTLAIENVLNDENWVKTIERTVETALRESVEYQINEVVRNAVRNAEPVINKLAFEALQKATQNLMSPKVHG